LLVGLHIEDWIASEKSSVPVGDLLVEKRRGRQKTRIHRAAWLRFILAADELRLDLAERRVFSPLGVWLWQLVEAAKNPMISIGLAERKGFVRPRLKTFYFQ
jgi:hypothetical protein